MTIQGQAIGAVAAANPVLPIEIAFLQNHGVGADLLRRAAEAARRSGSFADEALLKLASSMKLFSTRRWRPRSSCPSSGATCRSAPQRGFPTACASASHLWRRHEAAAAVSRSRPSVRKSFGSSKPTEGFADADLGHDALGAARRDFSRARSRDRRGGGERTCRCRSEPVLSRRLHAGAKAVRPCSRLRASRRRRRRSRPDALGPRHRFRPRLPRDGDLAPRGRPRAHIDAARAPHRAATRRRAADLHDHRAASPRAPGACPADRRHGGARLPRDQERREARHRGRRSRDGRRARSDRASRIHRGHRGAAGRAPDEAARAQRRAAPRARRVRDGLRRRGRARSRPARGSQSRPSRAPRRTSPACRRGS